MSTQATSWSDVIGEPLFRKGWDLCVASTPRFGVANRTRSSLNLQLIDGKIYSQRKSTESKDLGMVSPIALSDSVNLSYTNDGDSVDEEVNSCLVSDLIDRIMADANPDVNPNCENNGEISCTSHNALYPVVLTHSDETGHTNVVAQEEDPVIVDNLEGKDGKDSSEAVCS